MRPEILFPLFAPIDGLKGVGPRVQPLLEKVAGPLGRDVLYVAPQSLVRREKTKTAEAVEGEHQTLLVTIDSHHRPGRAGQPWKIRAYDDTGFVMLVWFKGHGVAPGAAASQGRAAGGKRQGREQPLRSRAADGPSGLPLAGRAGR